MTVPNEHPTLDDGKHRLCILGEAPGKDEAIQGRPFVGASGRTLTSLLSKNGITRATCLVGNVCQVQPPGNDLERFAWDGPEIKDGLAALKDDLTRFKPNCVLLLGNAALKAALDPWCVHPLKQGRYANAVGNWRGSLFLAQDGPLAGLKCCASLHPAYCLRDYSGMPLLDFDVRKAVRESQWPELKLTKRVCIIPESFQQAKELLLKLLECPEKAGTDIEGGVYGMSCISFAPSGTEGFTIPFIRNDHTFYWSAEEELELLVLVARVLEDPLIPKVLQNGLYDTFVLHYIYGIRIRGITDDTMLKGWEKYSELEKGLAAQCSLYTDQPYYKGDRKSNDDGTFYRYCALDSIVTYEIDQVLEGELNPNQLSHYHFNVAMQIPLRYMEMTGIRYDVDKAEERHNNIKQQMFAAKAELNAMTGHGFQWTSLPEIQEHAKALFYQKKDQSKPYAAYADICQRYNGLLAQSSPSLSTMGEIETLCEVSLDTNSPKALIAYLYGALELPTQWSTPPRGQEPKPTTDYEALLNLSKYCQKTEQADKLAIIQKLIEIQSLDTRQSMLSIGADSDGRIRCGYNIVGSETGRITCYSSPTGSGYNLQTIPNYTSIEEAPGGILGDRDLFQADPGYWLAACDLSGADAWTVACYCGMLGDKTMLDDLRAGLSPAKILTLMYEGRVGDYGDRAWLKGECKTIDKNGEAYAACKKVAHGVSYCEGNQTISRSILVETLGKVYIPPSECGKMRQFFLQRYWGIVRVHQWLGRQLSQRPVLRGASGFERVFLGRIDNLLPTAMATEPQTNTTYAINKATYNMWTDPLNQNDDGTLKLMPLHTVHDELVFQFPQALTDFAKERVPIYFNNTLVIANTPIVIPYEGHYGNNWAEAKNPLTAKGKI